MTSLQEFRKVAETEPTAEAVPAFIAYAKSITQGQEVTRVERVQAACDSIEEPTERERAVMFMARQHLGFDVPN